MFTEKDGKKKISDSGLFTTLYEVTTSKIFDEDTKCHPVENLDIVVSDGICLWVANMGCYMVYNATYVVVARPVPIPGEINYGLKLFTFPGLLDNEAKIDELLEKARMVANAKEEIINHAVLFAYCHTVDENLLSMTPVMKNDF